MLAHLCIVQAAEMLTELYTFSYSLLLDAIVFDMAGSTRAEQ